MDNILDMLIMGKAKDTKQYYSIRQEIHDFLYGETPMNLTSGLAQEIVLEYEDIKTRQNPYEIQG